MFILKYMKVITKPRGYTWIFIFTSSKPADSSDNETQLGMPCAALPPESLLGEGDKHTPQGGASLGQLSQKTEMNSFFPSSSSLLFPVFIPSHIFPLKSPPFRCVRVSLAQQVRDQNLTRVGGLFNF